MNLLKENEILGGVYLTEVKKKDILAGLDYMGDVYATPVYWTWWTLEDPPTVYTQNGGEKITHPVNVSRCNLDQAVRLLFQTDEMRNILKNEVLPDDVLNTDFSVPRSGVSSAVILKLLNYIKEHDGVAVFAEPHTESFYVVGLTKDATLEETENVFYQTIEDMEDLKTDFKKSSVNLNDLQNNEPD